MKFIAYKTAPEKVGYLGWVEDLRGNTIAFVRLDGTFQFEW